MSAPASDVTLISDPIQPWSASGIGMPALALVALILVGLTIGTYLGVRPARPRRVLLVLGLRLGALLLAVLAALRPSLAFRDDLRQPSKVLIVVDASQSMTIQDAFDGQSRWHALLRVLRECEPILQELRSQHQIDVILYQFAGDVREFDSQGQPDGQRTDFAQMLERVYRDHAHDRSLRAIIIASDGADNGRQPAVPLAQQWRNLPCPVHTVALGLPTTSDQQSDLIVKSITPEPSPVPVKGELTVKAVVDAPGFANAPVNFRLLIDDKEVPIEKVFINDRDVTNEKLRQLPLAAGNQVRLRTNAPPKPGEVKLQLKIDPLPGEVTAANNEIGTFLTVAKEGVSVLLVDKARFPEPQLLCDALSKDPRIRLHAAWLRRNEALDAELADLFQFDRQHYDVIILGDVSARRLSAGAPGVLAKIRELVDKKGTGLLMMGGYDSFGNSDWQDTDVAKLLPVHLNARGQTEGRVRMAPAEQGSGHFLLRLLDNPKDNAQLWAKLPELDGMTRMGEKKDGAQVFARSHSGELMMAGHDVGTGRVLAFAGDTTWRWVRSPEGQLAHSRFWRQLVLWLAKQEETEGSAWIKLDTRRLASGSQLGFSVGLRGKGGVEVQEGQYDVKVIGPAKAESAVQTVRDRARSEERGTFWKTDVPGEYRLFIRAKGKEADDQETSGEAMARFLVYQDTAEMSRRAADHDFLKKLASTGGGRFHRAEELARLLQELSTQPLPQQRPRVSLWPDWRQGRLSAFPVVFFFLFAGLLCLEWFLRRRWGMV